MSDHLDPREPHITPRIVVTWLWVFAILNYLYCDVLGLFDVRMLRDMLAGANGAALGEAELFAAGVAMSIPIAAIPLARLAPQRLARWYSIAAAVFMTVLQGWSLTVGSGPTPYYVYFSVLEIATTLGILWYAAARWSAAPPQRAAKPAAAQV